MWEMVHKLNVVQLKCGSFNVCVEYNKLVMNTTESPIKTFSSARHVSVVVSHYKSKVLVMSVMQLTSLFN